MPLRKNIRKYYITQFLWGLNFSQPIFFLFLLSNGLNYFQTLFTQSWFALIILLLQIPAGILSDLWSRKNVLLVGFVGGALGATIYALSGSLYLFLVAETFWAVAIAFGWGPLSAFLYESVIQTKQEHKSREIFSKGSFFHLLGGVIAAPIGGMVATLFGLRAAMALMILTSSLNFLNMLTAKDLVINRKERKESYMQQVKKSFNYVKGHELLLLLLISNVSIALMCWAGGSFFQPYLQNIGVDIKWFGFLFGSINLISAIVCRYSHSIENKFGIINSIRASTLLPSVGFLILGISVNPIFAIIGISLISINRTFRGPLFLDYYNKILGNDKRATVISFSDFSFWVFYLILNLAVGYLADLYGISPIFVIFSIIGFIVLLTIRIKNR